MYGDNMHERSEINKFLRTYKSSGSLIQTARDFAEYAHDGQLDKAGNPFITHVERVVDSIKDEHNNENLVIIAYLHDIIDDGGFSLSDLRMFFPDNIWSAVYHLSHNKTLSREDYFNQIIENHDAIIVKIADINDNLMMIRKSNISDKDYQKIIKCNREIAYLNSRL